MESALQERGGGGASALDAVISKAALRKLEDAWQRRDRPAERDQRLAAPVSVAVHRIGSLLLVGGSLDRHVCSALELTAATGEPTLPERCTAAEAAGAARSLAMLVPGVARLPQGAPGEGNPRSYAAAAAAPSGASGSASDALATAAARAAAGATGLLGASDRAGAAALARALGAPAPLTALSLDGSLRKAKPAARAGSEGDAAQAGALVPYRPSLLSRLLGLASSSGGSPLAGSSARVGAPPLLDAAGTTAAAALPPPAARDAGTGRPEARSRAVSLPRASVGRKRQQGGSWSDAAMELALSDVSDWSDADEGSAGEGSLRARFTGEGSRSTWARLPLGSTPGPRALALSGSAGRGTAGSAYDALLSIDIWMATAGRAGSRSKQGRRRRGGMGCAGDVEGREGGGAPSSLVRAARSGGVVGGARAGAEPRALAGISPGQPSPTLSDEHTGAGALSGAGSSGDWAEEDSVGGAEGPVKSYSSGHGWGGAPSAAGLEAGGTDSVLRAARSTSQRRVVTAAGRLIAFLNDHCSEDGASYWLTNGAGDGRFRLFEVADCWDADVSSAAQIPLSSAGGSAGASSSQHAPSPYADDTGAASELPALLGDPTAGDGAGCASAPSLAQLPPAASVAASAKPGPARASPPSARRPHLSLAHLATFSEEEGALDATADPLRARVDRALAALGVPAEALSDPGRVPSQPPGDAEGASARPSPALRRPAAPFVPSIANLCLRAAEKMLRNRFAAPGDHGSVADASCSDGFDRALCKSLFRRVVEVHSPLQFGPASRGKSGGSPTGTDATGSATASPADAECPDEAVSSGLGTALTMARAHCQLASLLLQGHVLSACGCLRATPRPEAAAAAAAAAGRRTQEQGSGSGRGDTAGATGPARNSGAAKRRRKRRKAAEAAAAAAESAEAVLAMAAEQEQSACKASAASDTPRLASSGVAGAAGAPGGGPVGSCGAQLVFPDWQLVPLRPGEPSQAATLADLDQVFASCACGAAAAAASAVFLIRSSRGASGPREAARSGGTEDEDAALAAVQLAWRASTGTASHALLVAAKLAAREAAACASPAAALGCARHGLALCRAATESGAWGRLLWSAGDAVGSDVHAAAASGSPRVLEQAAAVLQGSWGVKKGCEAQAAPGTGPLPETRVGADRGHAWRAFAAEGSLFVAELAAVRALLLDLAWGAIQSTAAGGSEAADAAVRVAALSATSGSWGDWLVSRAGRAMEGALASVGPARSGPRTGPAGLRAVMEVAPLPGAAAWDSGKPTALLGPILVKARASALLRVLHASGRGAASVLLRRHLWSAQLAEAWLARDTLKEAASLVGAGRVTKAAEVAKQAVALAQACQAPLAEAAAKVALSSVVADASMGLSGEETLSSRLHERFSDADAVGRASGLAFAAEQAGRADAEADRSGDGNGSGPQPQMTLGDAVDAAAARCCRRLVQDMSEGPGSEAFAQASVGLDRSGGITEMLRSVEALLASASCPGAVSEWCRAASSVHELLLWSGRLRLVRSRISEVKPADRRSLLAADLWSELRSAEDGAGRAANALVGLGCHEAGADALLEVARGAQARFSALQAALDKVMPAASDASGGDGLSRAAAQGGASRKSKILLAHAKSSAASLAKLAEDAKTSVTQHLCAAWKALAAAPVTGAAARLGLCRLVALSDCVCHLVALATADLRVVSPAQCVEEASALLKAASQGAAAEDSPLTTFARWADMCGLAGRGPSAAAATGAASAAAVVVPGAVCDQAHGASAWALCAAVAMSSFACGPSSDPLGVPLEAVCGAWKSSLLPGTMTALRFLASQVELLEVEESSRRRCARTMSLLAEPLPSSSTEVAGASVRSCCKLIRDCSC